MQVIAGGTYSAFQSPHPSMILSMSSARANIQPSHRIDSGLSHSSSFGIGGQVVGDLGQTGL
jgi:hypothetical protein